MTPILTVIRGLPGSGKSTLAATLHGVHVSADDFRYRGGIYSFAGADKRPFAAVRAVLAVAFDVEADIVLDGCNIRYVHYGDIVERAQREGYYVRYLFPQTPWAWDPVQCSAHTLHAVPADYIANMLAAFEGRPEE